MIERKFVADNIKEFQIKEFVKNHLGRVGLSDVKVQKTPLGEKIIISASRPGLVVGRAGVNIAKMTKDLKKEFRLENPQIEIEEVKMIGLDASIIAEMIAGSMERYGSARFKGIGYKAMTNVMDAGAIGVEILMSGKIPSSRGKTWRFYKGYLKKCGDISISGVQKAYSIAKLKTGVVGVRVSIMPKDIKLPDKIKLIADMQKVIEEVNPSEAEKIKDDIKKNAEENDKELPETIEKAQEEKTQNPKEKPVKVKFEKDDNKKEEKAETKVNPKLKKTAIKKTYKKVKE